MHYFKKNFIQKNQFFATLILKQVLKLPKTDTGVLLTRN
jgi:hypothetical protein